jgi:hypothetical protein
MNVNRMAAEDIAYMILPFNERMMSLVEWSLMVVIENEYAIAH